MKNLATILLSAIVLFAAAEIMAQNENADENAHQNANENAEGAGGNRTSDDTSIFDNDNDNSTTTDNDANNSTTANNGTVTTANNGTVTTTNNGADNDDNDNNNNNNSDLESELSSFVPNLSTECNDVFAACMAEASTDGCSVTERACMDEPYIDNDNGTHSCSEADLKEVDQYCFVMTMLKKAGSTSVENACKARLLNVTASEVGSVTDFTQTCSFLESVESTLTAASAEKPDEVCSADDYTDLHGETCFACKGALASLFLVLAMVGAQRLVTWI